MGVGSDLEKEKLYNQWHQDQSEVLLPDDFINPWYETVLKLLPEKFYGKIVEIGCGNGDFSIRLAKKYPDATIVGTDFSPTAIDIARSKLFPQLANISFYVENAEKLSFNDSDFDMVISCETMEHVFNPQVMATEMYRILKPGCRFILTTENYFNGLILSWIQSWIFKKPFNSGSGIQPRENFMLFFRTKSFLISAGFEKIRTQSNFYQWLLLPRVNPKRLRTEYFNNRFLRKVFKPFGRHYTYIGIKPLK